MLTLPFPYVRDWLNEHPFRNEVNARIICNIENGKPLLGVVNGCSKVGVIDLPTLTPTMMNCSSSYWCIMTGEGRIKDCWFLGEKGWINFTNHMYMKCFLVGNSI